MKVQCPSCDARYRIDLSKIPEIPEKGINITCPKCKAQVPIKIETGDQKEDRQDEIISCPDCGHVNISSDKCVSCGRMFSKEDKEKLTIGISKED